MLHTSLYNFFCIRPPQGLLPVLGPLERYMKPTLDAALLSCSRAGADLRYLCANTFKERTFISLTRIIVSGKIPTEDF